MKKSIWIFAVTNDLVTNDLGEEEVEIDRNVRCVSSLTNNN